MSALLAGLCSISFRNLDAESVLRMAIDCGLDCIEWGSDVHAPAADPRGAAALAKRCNDAGLCCPSYGSYFFAGQNDASELSPLLDTTRALGASTIRIWAPFGIDSSAAADERGRIADAVRVAAAMAAEQDLSVALEFHPGTLTETAASTVALLEDAGDNVFSYWQPAPGASAEHSLSELALVRRRLAHLHVFSWDPTPDDRHPLDHLESMWRSALFEAARDRAFAGPRCAYLEFLPDDDPQALRRDAAVLIRWIQEEAS